MCVIYLINTAPLSCWAWKAGSVFNTWRRNMSLLHTCCVSSCTLLRAPQAVEGYISPSEQLILNLLSPVIFPLTYNSMSKGQNQSYTHLILHSCYNLMTYSCPPYLGGGGGGNLTPALPFPPIFRTRWGWGCGWLGPPLSFIVDNAWVGAGGKGQPLRMTNLTYLTS
jgi:hypothetical protein